MMGWRNANASLVLVNEVNTRWPSRDRSSDGTIGDAAHAARTSDHNPWLQKGGQGIVRARDIDKDGIDAPWLAEYLRQLGQRGDPRLRPGGYVIFNHRITKPDFSGWKAYTGSNPHEHHVHVSFSTDPGPAGFDSTAGWGIAGAPAGGGGARPVLREGAKGDAVKTVQQKLRITADGDFGPKTKAAVIAFQRSKGLTADGIVGPNTYRALGL